MKSLEWIILISDNFSAARIFYKNVLGLKIVREVKCEEFTQFKLKNCYLAIYGRQNVAKLVGSKHLSRGGGAIYTFSKSYDVDKEVIKLKAKGVNFIKLPQTQTWGQRTAYFTDPDGHIWEIQKWVT